MKARVIETGEIVNVKFNVHPNPAVGETYWWCEKKQESFHKGELEFLGQVNPIDWEQVRINAAIAAMQAYIGNGDYVKYNSESVIAAWSVKQSDALIEELKKKQL